MKKLIPVLVSATVIALALTNCAPGPSPTAAPAAATSTSIPPTPTTPPPSPTPIPPTPTPVPPTPTPAPPPGTITFQNPQKYQVEYVATVYHGGFDITKLLVYQPRPIEWDGQEDVSVEEVSPPPTNEGTDPVFGNGMYFWQMGHEPKQGESISFKTLFTLTAYETTTTVDPDKVQPYDQDAPRYTLYTRSERFIEATHPRIAEIADQVAGEETNPYLLARRFYDYVIDSANYQLLGEGLLGAQTLASTGQGECGDYAALFVALCRTKGIPARPVVGYWAISGIEQTHVWAEFYLEALGWVPVDPTIGQDQPDRRDYYFGNMDNQRVILNKGFNLPLDPAGPDNYIAPFLQVPLWWFWGSSGDDTSVNIERTSWTVTRVQ